MKRLLDITVSVVSLILLSPLMALLAWAIKKKLGRPVIFKQKRPGMNRRPFWLYKFRTMTDKRNDYGNLLPDRQRMTRFGHFLRSTSLDELPELFNVIKGEMSLVGPRPLLMEYLDRYTPEQNRRHEVKPGITGWAQIKGRNAISWEEKFQMDVWYVDNQTFWLDIKILILTLWKIIKREGINQPGQATMTKFMGSRKDAEAQRNA